MKNLGRGMRPFVLSAPLAFLLAIAAGWTGPLEAAVLKKVYSGTFTMPAAPGTRQSVTVANFAGAGVTVDPTKAFLVFGVSTATTTASQTEPRDFEVRGQLTNATTLTFFRNPRTEATGADGDLTISWQVAEFTSGVTVQRGTLDFPNANTATLTATIAAVNLQRSFPLISIENELNTHDADDWFEARLNSTTQFAAQRAVGTTGTRPIMDWQVVEYDTCTVRTGTTTLSGGSSTTRTLTLPAPTINVGRSWLIYHFRLAGDVDSGSSGQMVRGRITSSNQLVFDRPDNGGREATIRYFLVSFTDCTIVAQGSAALPNSSTASATVNFSPPVTRDFSLVVGGAQAQHSGRSNSTSQFPGPGWGRFVFDGTGTTASSFTLTRSPGVFTTSRAADIPWWVIRFADASNCAGQQGAAYAEVEQIEAVRSGLNVRLSWRSGLELDNLGYRVYREVDGERTLVNRDALILGSALTMEGQALSAGRPYCVSDQLPPGTRNVRYWLEDVDADGSATLHGPVAARRSATPVSAPCPVLFADRAFVRTASPVESRGGPAYADVGSANAGQLAEEGEGLGPSSFVALAPSTRGFAIKLGVRREGYYRVEGASLRSLGLSPSVDPAFLQLLVNGTEVSMRVVTEPGSKKTPGLTAIEFYGRGLDTPYADERVYWLVVGTKPGKRIARQEAKTSPPDTYSYPFSMERRDRNVYVALRNGDDEDNFYGPIVNGAGASLSIAARSVSPVPASDTPVRLDVSLFGLYPTAHQVRVRLNGTDVGTISFVGRTSAQWSVSLPAAAVAEGENVVQLVPMNGATDVSVVSSVVLTYPRRYRVDTGSLAFSATSGQSIQVETGRPVRILDVTDENSVFEVGASPAVDPSFRVDGTGSRRLLAFSEDGVSGPASLRLDAPSALASTLNGADIVVLTSAGLKPALEPLVGLRRKEGYSVAVVDVEDVYDEFSFGTKSAKAIRDFVLHARSRWRLKPRFLLLAGDGTYDPRDFLRTGVADVLPIRMIGSSQFEVPSDDWFADADLDGVPELAVGRLPVRTLAEAQAVVDKIVRYEKSAKATGLALGVADTNDVLDFENSLLTLEEDMLSRGLDTAAVLRRELGDAGARSAILSELSSAPDYVTFWGHGSMDYWRGNLFTAADVANLRNEANPAVWVLMTCLNGYFAEPIAPSLSQALLRSAGGGVAAWAPSGYAVATSAMGMENRFYELFLPESRLQKGLPLGLATLEAKKVSPDPEARKTWILFGDPAMSARR